MRARGIDELGERFFDATLRGPRDDAASRPRAGARATRSSSTPRRRARIDLAVRNVRVLARGAMRALALDENVPPEVADALEDLARGRARARAARWRRGEGFDAVREPGAARGGDRDPRARGHDEPVRVA